MFRFIDFKNLADVSVDLSRPVTLLIGPNGSGKSNLIEALQLFSFTAGGRLLSNVTDAGREGALEIRGGLDGCCRNHGPAVSMELTTTSGPSQMPVRYSLVIGRQGEVLAERLDWRRAGSGAVVFQAKLARPGVLDVQYEDFTGGPDWPELALASNRSALSQYESFSPKASRTAEYADRYSAELAACDASVKAVRGELLRLGVLAPVPRLMRGYERMGQASLRTDGGNLSSILDALSTGTEDERAALQRITDRARQVPEEAFAQLRFVRTLLGDVTFLLQRKDSEFGVDARLLSDGTLRALALLTALETCAAGTRLVFEEFDNGIHPSRVKGIVDAVFETAKRRNLNVLLTTHSPATLDAVPDEELQSVLVAHWDAEKQATTMTPLLELPNVSDLLVRGKLGDLVTKRILDQYFTKPSDEDLAKQADEWVRLAQP